MRQMWAALVAIVAIVSTLAVFVPVANAAPYPSCNKGSGNVGDPSFNFDDCVQPRVHHASSDVYWKVATDASADRVWANVRSDSDYGNTFNVKARTLVGGNWSSWSSSIVSGTLDGYGDITVGDKALTIATSGGYGVSTEKVQFKLSVTGRGTQKITCPVFTDSGTCR